MTIHGGYPGVVRMTPRRVQITEDLVMVDGKDTCAHCGNRMRQEDNPHGGDTWFFRCPQGHEAWVGK